jgi:hypothetical protein
MTACSPSVYISSFNPHVNRGNKVMAMAVKELKGDEDELVSGGACHSLRAPRDPIPLNTPTLAQSSATQIACTVRLSNH